MHSPARMVGTAAVAAVTLLVAACSGGDGGGGVDLSGADVEDGTLAGDALDEALDDLGDLPDSLPQGEAPHGDGGDDEGWGDWGDTEDWGAGVAGSWFSTAEYANYLSFYDDGSVVLLTATEECVGSFTESGASYALDLTGCASPYAAATATLASDTLEVSWADGSAETYSRDAGDVYDPGPDGGGGTGDTGEEIEGVWAGNDGSVVGIASAQSTGTGLANMYYLDASGTEECAGLLTALSEGWMATVACGESDSGDVRSADLTRNGEALDVTWQDGTTATYTWLAPWDDASTSPEATVSLR